MVMHAYPRPIMAMRPKIRKIIEAKQGKMDKCLPSKIRTLVLYVRSNQASDAEIIRAVPDHPKSGIQKNRPTTED